MSRTRKDSRRRGRLGLGIPLRRRAAPLQIPALAQEIDLSDPALAAAYKSACIDLHPTGPNGEKVAQPKCGAPIFYAVSIAADAPHPEAAAQFVKALYSEAGRKALESAFQQPLPAEIGGNANIA